MKLTENTFCARCGISVDNNEEYCEECGKAKSGFRTTNATAKDVLGYMLNKHFPDKTISDAMMECLEKITEQVVMLAILHGRDKKK